MQVGDLIFVCGQFPVDPGTGNIVDGDIEKQTAQVFRNIAAVLEESGSSLSKVVKTTVYLADLASFGEMNRVYAESFGDHRPARALSLIHI